MNKDELQKKRAELKRLEKEHEDQQWKEAVKKATVFYSDLIDKPLLSHDYGKNFNVLKIKKVEQSYYADSSGFYGQYDQRRFFNLYIEGYTVYNNRIRIKDEIDVNIIPVFPKKSWKKAYNRVIDLGNIEVLNKKLVIGEKTYKARNANRVLMDISDFKVFRRHVDEEFFQSVKAGYIEQIQAAQRSHEKVLDYLGKNFHKLKEL